MPTRLHSSRLILMALALFALPAATAERIDWSSLKPAGEDAHNQAIFDAMLKLAEGVDGRLNPDMASYGVRFERLKGMLRYNAAPKMQGRRVRLAGYIVPLDAIGRGITRDFLFVPYFGACLHLPAPNPNQLIHVTAGQAQTIGRIDQAYWIEGVLSTERYTSRTATAAYGMKLDRIERYKGTTNPYSGPIPHPDGN